MSYGNEFGMYEIKILKKVYFRGIRYYEGETRVINGPTYERFRKFGICDTGKLLNPLNLSEWEGCESGPGIVLGGGPSLRNFPWEALEKWGPDILACNMAIRYAPHAKYMVSMDFTPILEDPEKHKDVLAFEGQVFVKYDGAKIHPESREFDVVEAKPRGYITENFTEGVHACHSGMAAAQIAMHLGYNPIYLLGVDCKMGPKELRFHHYDDGLEYEYDGQRMAWWAAEMNAQSRSYYVKGVQVINLGPDSALIAYESQDWREVLKWNK